MQVRNSLWLALVALCAAPAESADRLNGPAFASQYFGHDAPWYQNRIPYFECSDATIQNVYYYRWKIFRAHQRDNGAVGYISTEFLNDVGWQRSPWASLPDATGFHISEGRWLRDARFADDYLQYMLPGGGDDRHFTDWIGDSVWQRYLVDGNAAAAVSYLNPLQNLYNQWNDSFDTSKGLYYREPIADATEYTISSIDASGGQDGFFGGTAFRPSINSYQWANAMAISQLATMAGNSALSQQWANRASTLKTTFQNSIWNTTLGHFIDRYQYTNQYVTYWNPIRGRELVGFVPWMFNMPDSKYSSAWQHLMRTDRFLGVNGFRTNEPSYQYYMRQYRYDGATGLRECQWNGPVWPYQTTQVLIGMANLLNNYQQTQVNISSYMQSMRTYSQLHYINQTSLLDLVEDYEPDKRTSLVELPRSHHYFHSAFNDLVISGLVGLRPQANDTLIVNPLIDSSITYFCLQNVLYHGHNVSITWDSNGNRYSRGAGLTVEVDGAVASQTSKIGKVSINLSRVAPPAIQRPISISNPLGAKYPQGSATSGSDSVAQAIDGRVWFFPEETNGWNSDPQNTDTIQSYTIDFGQSTAISRAEIAIFADGQHFILPSTYNVSSYDGTNFNRIIGFGEQLLDNGITNVQWSTLSTSKVQFSFPQPAGKQVRLVEFKVFA